MKKDNDNFFNQVEINRIEEYAEYEWFAIQRNGIFKENNMTKENIDAYTHFLSFIMSHKIISHEILNSIITCENLDKLYLDKRNNILQKDRKFKNKKIEKS